MEEEVVEEGLVMVNANRFFKWLKACILRFNLKISKLSINQHILLRLGGGAKPSYGGGGKGFDIPKLNIPNPIDFKAGVLRYEY